MPSSHPAGQLDFPTGQVTFHSHLPDGQEPRQVGRLAQGKQNLRATCPKGKPGFNFFFKHCGTHLHTGVHGERHCENKVSCPKTLSNVPGQCSDPDQSIRPCCLHRQATSQIKKNVDTYHTIPQATLLALMIRCQSDVAS